jgi:hypothetical protein
MIPIIAFAGRKQSGKTTSAEFVETLFHNMSVGNCKIYNFADPLKLLCVDILGLEYRQCYGTDEDKNETVDCYWDDHQLTAREVLQIVGTDIFRRMKHNVWSDATIRKIYKEKPELAIIADCRFPNEVMAIKTVGGFVIKLNRDPYNSHHASEIALDPEHFDQSMFDLVINNHNVNITEQNKLIYEFIKNKRVLPL